MGRINMARVVLGGLLAGLIINAGEALFNGVLIKDQVDALLQRMNLPAFGGSTIAVFVVSSFLLGIAAVWLYAAIRPRFGAGLKTALCAGAAVWFFAYLYPGIGMTAMGMIPTNLMALGTLWGLVELLVATAAGAWLYQEGPETVAVRAGA
jgi:hypothetical protein